MALAGFSSGEAEGLRRAMSRKRSQEAIAAPSTSSSSRAPPGARRRAARSPSGSGRRSRASRASASRRRTRPPSACSPTSRPGCGCTTRPEFLCALLNEQPMGFYPPDSLVHEAQRAGIAVLGVRRQPQPGPLPGRAPPRRAGRADRARLRQGVREEEMEALVAERERGGPYRGSPSSPRARGPGRDEPGAAGLGRGAGRDPRRRAAASAAGRSGGSWHRRRPRRRGGQPAGAAARSRPRPPELEPLGSWGETIAELPLDRDRPRRAPDGAAARGSGPGSAAAPTWSGSPTARTVEVAGMVVARQRPETAKGIVFMLLEDERGTVNLIVPPRVYERYRSLVRSAPWSAPAAASSAAKARPISGDRPGGPGRRSGGGPPGASPRRPGTPGRGGGAGARGLGGCGPARTASAGGAGPLRGNRSRPAPAEAGGGPGLRVGVG